MTALTFPDKDDVQTGSSNQFGVELSKAGVRTGSVCTTQKTTKLKWRTRMMNYNLGQGTKKSARSLFVAALVLACAFGTVTPAVAESVKPPATPSEITPEAGNVAFAVGHALGTQGYICLPTSTGGTSWTILNARPEATLFVKVFGQDVQIITHFLSPDNSANHVARATWQSSFDTSKVWAARVNGIPAGSDPVSCPNTGAIDCLLLEQKGTQDGPTGGKFLSKTTFVQRLNTRGGSAPADNAGCKAATDVGHQLLVPYSADYFFYRAAE
jgi:Protein of unknown function (DUF3455)